MNPIKIKTNQIIIKLSLNKDLFIKSFDAIVDTWKALDAKFQSDYILYSSKVANQTLKDDEYPPNPPQKPVNRVKTYNFYIDFFTSDENKDQLLDEDDYRRFIKDDWEWTAQHRLSLGYYLQAASTSSSTISANTLGTLSSMKDYYDTR